MQCFEPHTDDEMAEVQGIEPSTLRWHGFQDRLSTLLAYLQNSMRVPQRVTHNHTWSEWQDSNLRPSAPKADALPDCATLGYLWSFDKVSILGLSIISRVLYL